MARRTTKARPLKAKRKFNGKIYKKKGATHRTKTIAKASAKASRARKQAARVVKTKRGYTVYTRG